jgi:hypothetical protein
MGILVMSFACTYTLLTASRTAAAKSCAVCPFTAGPVSTDNRSGCESTIARMNPLGITTANGTFPRRIASTRSESGAAPSERNALWALMPSANRADSGVESLLTR